MSEPQKQRSVKTNSVEVRKVDALLGKLSKLVRSDERAATPRRRVETAELVFTIDEEQATITGYCENLPAALDIPDAIEGFPVSAIAEGVFEGVEKLQSVRGPGSLVQIGRRAFADCKNLGVVTFQDGLETIQAEAFRGCAALTDVSLPASVNQINRYSFAECTALEAIELPEELRVINKGTFEGATALASVALPYGLTRIGMDSFRDCKSLQSLYYYSMRGISDVMITDRDLKLESLPTLIEHIGSNAFLNCTSLRRVEIPRNVVEISTRAFSGCRRLRYVGLHNRIKSIGAHAFRGCVNLKNIRVPYGCKDIGTYAFSVKTTVIASRTSFAARYCQDSEQPWRAPSTRGAKLSSTMVPRQSSSAEHEPFYTRRQVAAAVERYEIRHPSYRTVKREEQLTRGEVPASRFSYDGEVYHGAAQRADFARIMVVGDLMSRLRQQTAAAATAGTPYDFAFEHVRDLFAEADFVSGNLETAISPSAPYTLEMEHVDARPHLNTPPEFLSAIRRAGIDCVTNAQNHVYDAGTRGVFETLDAANANQLMHTGAFVSGEDRRFLVVDLGGIRIGILAYLDSARQMMKKANFTKVGLETMFPYFDEEKITADVAAAREAGAEYVIANCHWGREYTPQITDRQREFARKIADAGADYIVGAHSHCVQPHEVITSSDGRRVPCLWSAGNFISDINLKPPITRDTLIVDLLLHRRDDGKVYLANEAYHACRIMNLRVDDGEDRDYTVVPTYTDLGGRDLNNSLHDAKRRIEAVVGPEFKPVG
ncbi:leucine-rich repeat protein [Glutamicibacter soli]|uniref:Leucine-rich repeat protein n=1 Tax=Glutamicibacter soli TaxID=453836 RepID=A0A6L9GC20_9MICC|nr:leucine-rich repeat protein [Glutamicibacter soli]